jgi:F-type H+-transporting ATPase subunit delta
MHEYLDKRYALAFYELAEEKGKALEYLNELAEVIKIIDENKEFLQIINHPNLSTSKKKQLFESIFKGKIEESILSFLLIIIEKNRMLEIDGILEEVKKIHLKRNKTVEAYVETVVPLTNEERDALINKLQRKYNKTIIIKEEINKDIIGGVFVRVGNDIIDGTIKLKLEEMRKLALKTE